MVAAAVPSGGAVVAVAHRATMLPFRHPSPAAAASRALSEAEKVVEGEKKEKKGTGKFAKILSFKPGQRY